MIEASRTAAKIRRVTKTREHTGAHQRMSSAAKRRALAEGPLGWRNWKACQLRTRRGMEGYEVALYSDSRFVGELLDLGPYMVFNTIANGVPTAGAMTLGLVLRVEEYGASYIETFPPMDKPTVGTYHGGWLADEIAALISLALSVRCQAGEVNRRFYGQGDRGVPTQWSPAPIWPSGGRPQRAMLPNVVGSSNLGEARHLLQSYPSLPAPGATALVRAARQFQRALLIAETDPNTAWLQLVSAVEVAAVHHMQDELGDWKTLEAAWPKMADELRVLDPEHRSRVAAMLARQVRATVRYQRFLKEFRPPPPAPRPAEERSCVPWSKGKWAHAVDKIYAHRSHALHEGVPFPPPLCTAPAYDGEVAQERGFGLGVGSGDAYWPPEELPMHLHIYVHIVAHALRQWWASMAT